MAIPKTIPANIETVEMLLDEVDEYCRRFHRVRQKLSRFKRGSEPYLDRLTDLDVAAARPEVPMNRALQH